jgi:hypothetical protein
LAITPLLPDSLGLLPVALIQPLSPTATLTDAPSGTAQSGLSQLNAGQRIIADVQAQLSDGSFLVKIGDTTSRMNLPASTTVGEKLALTLIDQSPLPTFILNADPATSTTDSSIVSLSNNTTSPLTQIEHPASLTPLLNTNQPASTTESSIMTLSNAGKLIASLLQPDTPTTLLPLLGKMPIVAQANVPTPQLAHALQQTVALSGLFYESHLNEWASGQRTIAEIKQEPQASQTSQIVGGSETSSLVNTQMASAPINNPVLGQLVHQQLQTLEQNRIVWQGELWPGQALQWEISEEAARHNTAQTPPSWRSTVRFELPQLGVITAHLHLTGEHVSMQVHADTPAVVQRLQAQGPALDNALAAAGISLSALQVKTSE